MMKIAGVLILVLAGMTLVTRKSGRLIAFVRRYMLTHYPGLVVPPICIEDIAKKCGWNNLTPACVMEEMDSCH
uniref:Bifunctional inhibitor/plant lipid transfer protein/seed storage helical domain-containing protein n=1 Tax=Oryza glumipatula TaxID=40148 RepID=A0A0E0AQB2_9ORYZ